MVELPRAVGATESFLADSLADAGADEGFESILSVDVSIIAETGINVLVNTLDEEFNQAPHSSFP